MANALSPVAKSYRRCALQRQDDAEALHAARRSAGAVYLAGYAVECIVKSLLLSTLPVHRQADFAMNEFRGAQGHRLAWLWDSYIGHGGAKFSPAIARRFSLVSGWTPELRYDPRDIRDRDAEVFLDAAREIIAWAKGRL